MEKVLSCSQGENGTVSRRGILAALSGIGLAGLLQKSQATSPNPPLIQPTESTDAAFIKRAFSMRDRARELGDQAYGTVIVHSGKIIGESWSRVVLDGDPTAHAEMSALRDVARRFGSEALIGAIMYSSSHPCSMCQAAAAWVGISAMIHGRGATNAGTPRSCG